MAMQKFQVFVSSTFDDLRVERDSVVRAILEMGHIPVGMEMFSAADDEQWKIITRHIDESDYYVVVIAHRYGSCLPDGHSYTRREYEYALAKGVPVLGFIIDPAAEWPGDRVDTDPVAVEGLKDFINRAKEKPCDFWTSADDLHGKCAVALMKAFTANPREGWVRAHEVAGPAVTAELTRLSAENARLRAEVEAAEAESRSDYEERLRELVRTLRANTRNYSFKRAIRGEWEWTDDVTLLDIFRQIGPSLMAEENKREISTTLAMHAAGEPPWHLSAMNQVSDILADLVALELVEPSPRKHSVADDNEYWTLTELGRATLRSLRQARLRSADQTPTAEPTAEATDQSDEAEGVASEDETPDPSAY